MTEKPIFVSPIFTYCEHYWWFCPRWISKTYNIDLCRSKMEKLFKNLNSNRIRIKIFEKKIKGSKKIYLDFLSLNNSNIDTVKWGFNECTTELFYLETMEYILKNFPKEMIEKKEAIPYYIVVKELKSI